jgi:hypothetical protein
VEDDRCVLVLLLDGEFDKSPPSGVGEGVVLVGLPGLAGKEGLGREIPGADVGAGEREGAADWPGLVGEGEPSVVVVPLTVTLVPSVVLTVMVVVESVVLEDSPSSSLPETTVTTKPLLLVVVLVVVVLVGAGVVGGVGAGGTVGVMGAGVVGDVGGTVGFVPETAELRSASVHPATKPDPLAMHDDGHSKDRGDDTLLQHPMNTPLQKL